MAILISTYENRCFLRLKPSLRLSTYPQICGFAMREICNCMSRDCFDARLLRELVRDARRSVSIRARDRSIRRR